MFKSLLRTLPSLSGNFTIACKLNEIEKDTHESYHTYVRVADLMPLQNNIYKDSIELNLLNGKYEHDVKKYFSKYSNYFYKENYVFNKKNYKTLNLDSLYNEDNDDRNKDYEFGCKRIYFSRTGYQFSFYAPFYLDDVNDLPEYFCLNINIDSRLSKHIKIYIDKENKVNYLKRYLSSYFNQVDQKVIFCLPDSLQATYFGIDVKKGGLVQYKDNMFGYLFNNQTMINSFDNIICKGFERNNLIMRQIIPLSFMFNINDIFNEYERDYFNGYKMQISGYYCTKNDVKLDMFDFDLDYFSSYDKYKKYNERSGKYEKSNGKDSIGLVNVMNVGYPALNESKYVKYEFENKISPNYCKFKLMLSPDDDPYITNTNFAYSYLQYPNQKYGYFPTTLKGITPGLICINKDIKLPLGKNIDTYYNTSKYFANTIITNNVNYNKFLKLMQNYVGTWFNIYNDEDLDQLCKTKYLWSDVVFDYAYFNGILYNLFNLSSYSIDKFGVFVNYDLKVSEEGSQYKSKYVYSYSDESQINTYNFNDSYNTKIYDSNLNLEYYSRFFTSNVVNKTYNQSYLHYDKVMKKDLYGKYVIDENYKSENVYVKLSDLENIIIKSNFSNKEKTNIIKLLNINKILGYIPLDGVNNINYFEEYYDIYNQKQKRFILSNVLFGTNNKEIKYEWLLNKLFYSTVTSTKKLKLSSGYNKLGYDENIDEKFIIYLEEEFIYLCDFYTILTDTFGNVEDNQKVFIQNACNQCLVSINNLKSKYIFEPYGKLNDIVIENYFINVNEIVNSKTIYVDSYNLNNLIDDYNKKYNKSISLNSLTSKEYFIKVLNKEHIKEYYFKINKDVNGMSALEFDDDNNYVNKSLLECLYVKERIWNIDSKSINAFDTYTTLYNYILKYVVSYTENDNNIDDITKTNLELITTLINSDNETIYNWVYSNISDTRNLNNKFELAIGTLKIELDLCIKKLVYKLNESLFNLMYNNNTIINYLYLYIEDTFKTENNDIWNIIDSSYIENYNNNIKYYDWESKTVDKRMYVKNLNECLSPLFTDVYVNDNNKEIITYMIQNNKINNYTYIVSNELYFKEINTYNVLFDIYKNKEYIVNQLYNSIYSSDNTTLYEKIKKLLDNNLALLQKTLLLYFNDFSSNLASHASTKINLKSYNKDTITEANKDKLINALIYVVKNKNKQISLEKYLKDNNLLDLFNNEIWPNYIIDNNVTDLENVDYKIEAQLKFLQDYDEFYYTLIKDNGITLYSIQDNLLVSFDKFNNDNVKYDEINKIYIYKHNGLTYGFYFINVNFDNSNFSFNIMNDFNLNVSFNTINGYDISDKKKINQLFSILYPFMKVNIFEEFSKNINTIIYQNELEILIKYTEGNFLSYDESLKYKNFKTTSNDSLYNSLVEFDKYKRIKILRYFNYITPYIKKIENIINNVWTLRTMEYNTNYNDIEKNNIMNVKNINIYKYHPLTVYHKEYNQYVNNANMCYEFKDSYTVNQNEYKHFNDNVLYNLPETIELYEDKIYNEKEILELENQTEYLQNKKIDILYNFFNRKGLDYTNIKLFLFNKYNSSFFIEKDNNKYRIKYIFNLI